MLFGVLLVGLGASAADAQPRGRAAAAAAAPKVSRACGESAIPLVVGNEWVYAPPDPPEHVPDLKEMRQFPQQAKKVTIDVVGVETANAVTTVQLEEDIDGHKVKTSITCTADRFTIDPQSFWFAGDPGGVYNVDLASLQHKEGTTLKIVAGKLEGPEWRDDIVASWQQTATAGASQQLWKGKLEIERDFKLGAPELITVKLDGQDHQYPTAQKLMLTISGRITLDPPDKDPMEFPDMSNTYWLVDGVGIVQVQNSYGPAADDKHASFGHKYKLVSVKLH
jgi:hypothetical protein